MLGSPLDYATSPQHIPVHWLRGRRHVDGYPQLQGYL